MLTWVIMGAGVPDLKVQAKSFDQALAKARAVDSRYCGGYVDEED